MWDLPARDLSLIHISAVLENADITTDDIRSQSSEITLSADGGSMQYHYLSLIHILAQRFERTVGVINNDSDSEFQKIADGEMTAAESPTLAAWCDYNDQILQYANSDHMGMDYDVACADFSNGKGAFMLSGTWMLSTIKQNNPDADVSLIAFPNPTGGETKVPINVDTAFSVGETCKDIDICLLYTSSRRRVSSRSGRSRHSVEKSWERKPENPMKSQAHTAETSCFISPS